VQTLTLYLSTHDDLEISTLQPHMALKRAVAGMSRSSHIIGRSRGSE
jgi:hypothetical protein